MSRGKYSPAWVNKECIFNAYGKTPVPCNEEYDEKTMFADYDDEGYDGYGYSTFNAEGEYVGIGRGIDRNGYTETEYLQMSDHEWEDIVSYGGRKPPKAKSLVDRDAERYRFLVTELMEYKPAGYDGCDYGRFDLVIKSESNDIDAVVDGLMKRNVALP